MWKTAMLVAAACALAPATVPGQTPRPAGRASVADLGWLAGTWAGQAGGSAIEERWTPAEGGAMLGVSRTVKGGRMVAFEFLRIVERDGTLVYVAQPGGRPPTDFVLTGAATGSLTFENASHDFPKLIRYTLKADGQLEAAAGNGAGRTETFVFTRQP